MGGHISQRTEKFAQLLLSPSLSHTHNTSLFYLQALSLSLTLSLSLCIYNIYICFFLTLILSININVILYRCLHLPSFLYLCILFIYCFANLVQNAPSPELIYLRDKASFFITSGRHTKHYIPH